MPNETEILTRFDELQETLRRTRDHLGERIVRAADVIADACAAGGGVFLFGNGGSAADAQHIAGELVGRFFLDRPAIRAQALTTDCSVLTCLSNDFGYETIFARQLEAHGGSGDVAVGLTTSGNSPNVVAGLQKARAMGMKTIALTGQDGGQCAQCVDVLLDVPAAVTPRVQEAHMLIYHIICERVERVLAGKA